MARREQFRLPGGTPIETGVDWNGRWFVGYRKGSSMGFTCPVALRKWLGLPLKTPSREAFDAWIASLEEADTAKEQGNLKPGLTSWGPEAHQDEQDPALSTKMVL
jgi:hypothetical protein